MTSPLAVLTASTAPLATLTATSAAGSGVLGLLNEISSPVTDEAIGFLLLEDGT